ncbi:YciI family protein [Pelagicoccus sp. SDUM812002]|uniref:YciI family protein n=1 Tax=Pelagicoccus sp. SDUM812002 TaxID=3041266 RepID=UPI00280E31CA|nr:YciI family protein [Pelagicoccus sp. SDUM812002]MDQ8184012.1 YciI family protein [Pelagicoccus sp. SDUM812002]
MRVMVMVKATKSSETGELPKTELMAEMGRFNEELVEAGIMRSGDGLKPSSQGVRVRFSGKDRSVTDGPFAETKELIAGYWVWEVDSMQHAIDWVKRCPNPMLEDSDIEIRPFYEMSDFAELDPSGDLSENEDVLRDAISMQSADVRPYLFFGGRCEEALEFYKKALNAKVGMVMRHSESPEPAPEGMLPEGFENKIMHAEFTVGKITLMASDGCGESVDAGSFRLALTVPTESDAQRVFASLADGGESVMPLEKTFWSPCFGMVTDKFSVGWMVMVPDHKNPDH